MTRDPIPVPRTWLPGRDVVAFVHAIRAARPGRTIWHVTIGVDPGTTAALGFAETDWRVHALELDGDDLVLWAAEERRAVVAAVVPRASVARIQRGWSPQLVQLLAQLLSLPFPASVADPPIPRWKKNLPGPIVTLHLHDGGAVLLQVDMTHHRSPVIGGIHSDNARTALARWLDGRL